MTNRKELLNGFTKKLKKQVKIAAWQFSLFFIIIGVSIGGILLVMTTGKERDYNGTNQINGTGYTIIIIIAIIFASIFIAKIALFILGIINACAIHSITNKSVILIVFSIITLWVGHLIVAIIQRNTFADFDSSKTQKSLPEKDSLKDAFVNGVISAKEYEAKKNNANNKK